MEIHRIRRHRDRADRRNDLEVSGHASAAAEGGRGLAAGTGRGGRPGPRENPAGGSWPLVPAGESDECLAKPSSATRTATRMISPLRPMMPSRTVHAEFLRSSLI